MRIVSHRANGFGFQENSIKAFVEALKSSIETIEIDLRLTKDNVYVANHDPSFRKNLFRRFIHESDFKDIQFRFHSIKSYLDLFQETPNKHLRLDIKDQGKEIELVKELKKRNLIDRVTIISWLPKVLENVRNVEPNIKTSFIFVPFMKTGSFRINAFLHHLKPLIFMDDLNLKNFNKKHAKGYSHIHLFSGLPDIDVDSFDIPHLFLNQRVLNMAKERDIPINVFTINNKHSYKKFLDLGINYLTTDNPSSFM